MGLVTKASVMHPFVRVSEATRRSVVWAARGRSQWPESQPSKLAMRVRFPSPAPSPALGTVVVRSDNDGASLKQGWRNELVDGVRHVSLSPASRMGPLGQASPYTHAKDAPPAMQDARAADLARSILNRHGTTSPPCRSRGTSATSPTRN